jgi:hypothetical protein
LRNSLTEWLPEMTLRGPEEEVRGGIGALIRRRSVKWLAVAGPASGSHLILIREDVRVSRNSPIGATLFGPLKKVFQVIRGVFERVVLGEVYFAGHGIAILTRMPEEEGPFPQVPIKRALVFPLRIKNHRDVCNSPVAEH